MLSPLVLPVIGSTLSTAAGSAVTYFITRNSNKRAHDENLNVQEMNTLSERVSRLESINNDLNLRNDKLAEDNTGLRAKNIELSAIIQEKSNQLTSAMQQITELRTNLGILKFQYEQLFEVIQKLQNQKG